MLGTAASVLGRLLTRWKVQFAFGTAFLSLVAGVALLSGPLIRRRIPSPSVRRKRGAAGAFLYGLLYSVATITTSGGPLLLLLTVAAAIGRPGYGALLALAYAVGRGLPFLLLGLFAERVGRTIGRLDKYQRLAEVLSGIALLGLSLYFVQFALNLS